MANKEYRNKEWLKSQFDLHKTPSKVSEETGYPRTCITRYAEKFNLYKKKYTRNKSNYVDENYFETIDSAEKAYFLGFIMADGNIYKSKQNDRYQFSIKIKNTDKNILLKFANAIGFDSKKIIERKENRNGSETWCAEIKIYNRIFCQHLINKGIIPRKTGKEIMPIIDSKYKKDFIRGFIDGDGWIGKDYPQVGYCSSSFELVIAITKYLREELKIDLGIQKQKGVYVVKTSSKKKVFRILNHLYYNNCIALDRKQSLAITTKQFILDDLTGPL